MTWAMKSGNEPLHAAGAKLGPTLVEFWRWAFSNLTTNIRRGILAEYVVGLAVGASSDERIEWESYDLRLTNGTTIEVKSAAYLQSWEHQKLSAISFQIGKRKAYDYETMRWKGPIARQSDVYVFALLMHQDRSSLDPLDVSQWEFYVVPTAMLDLHAADQKTISLSVLRALAAPVAFHDLARSVDAAADTHKKMKAT